MSGTQAQLTGVRGRGPEEVYAYGLQSTLLTSRGDGRWRAVSSNFRGQFNVVWGPRDSRDLFLVGERFFTE
jgi:hypothetical protein